MTQLVGAEWWRLPVEMQQLNQWCLAGPDKAPYLAGPSGPYHASPVVGPWMDFETACSYARQYGWGIGFIITENDPYTCIDMDVKDVESRDPKGNPYPPELWTSFYSLEFYRGIVEFADSYTELSASKKGLHVWVRGDIGKGRRGKGIEVYSKERFIVCTGVPVSKVQYHILNNVAIPVMQGNTQLPIRDGDMILQNLTKELGLADTQIELEEVEADLSDGEIWKRACTAGNHEKFVELCAGRWQQYGFPSQSEADLALMSMFTFYSKSNEQCRRMFRQTLLGTRDKAVKNDVYLNRTLEIIRARQAKEQARSDHGAAVAAPLLRKFREQEQQAGGSPAPNVEADPRIKDYVAHLDQQRYTEAEPNVVHFQPPEVDGLEWPPGLVGAIAGFIYRSAPRPVKEVAIVAALGLMAGITGKAYNVGQTGLNLYIILIARSAIGKEAMHSGIGHILRSPCGHVVSPFVNFNDFASGPALVKGMEGFPSFVNVSGEWGRKLQRMAEDKRDGPMQQLRTAMTNLYQKSGAASVVGGLTYSNKEQNVQSTNAIAYSMIGETTPGTFYDALTDTMMEDGFLSRFNIVEYLGDRPPENENQLLQVPQDISDTLSGIASHCASVAMSPNVIQVKMDPQAEAMLKEFNIMCDEEIRKAGSDESQRQMWNRAHLKAIRVSGVLAASDNHINPVITPQHAHWSIELIKKDVYSMRAKILGGDIGADDTARFKKLQSVLEEFLRGRVSKSYKVDPRMVADGIVPRSYLAARTGQVRCFQNYKLGTTLALDHTLKTAIDSGYIMEVNGDKAVELYGYHGRCFRVLDLDR